MPDPDDGRASDSADSASWGAIQIWVKGQNLCAHMDQNEALQGAHWYLLPVFEWFAANWNPIFHEEQLPNTNSAEDAMSALRATRFPPQLAGEAASLVWDEERFQWRSRHALRTARDGGMLPNIAFRRLRDAVEISWNDERVAGTPDGFYYTAASSWALVAPATAANPIFEVLTAATSYLLKELPQSDRVKKLHERLVALTVDGNRTARLEWLAGLREKSPLEGGFQASKAEREVRTRWKEIVDALDEVGNPDGARAALRVDDSPLVISGSCHASLMFSSVSPRISYADISTLSSVIVGQYSRSSVGELAKFSDSVELDPGFRPWEQGYELAEAMLDDLGVDLSAGYVDIAAILDRLGVAVLSRRLEDDNIRACCISGEDFLPTVIRNESSFAYRRPTASRFTLAHELCHLLFDRTKGKKLAIVSGPWAPKGLEQRSNAFAAMFLMPPELVKFAIRDLPDPVHEIAGISTVAAKLQVGRRAIIGHLFNLTLMSETDRDKLLILLNPE